MPSDAASQVPYIVGLACSAGGLDALTRILSDLPTDFPAAVVVLQHQHPSSSAMLAPLLARRSALPVLEARDYEPIRPGTVVVAPAGHHTLVRPDLRLALIDSGDHPPYRPSADLLFVSMALSVGRRAVAVVLSGYGNDGATVVASDASSSAVFVMPAATIARDETVDYVIPVEGIAAALIDITKAAAPT
ncbi:chemotaxis protein CheB [Paractinoplanes hotanensis]|uniref:protein-glutamate methylesterase n=1 Tax=Paractinoplanes hotanensis TaxID=2906497 RepID=A0ABT0YFX7_9ACTN|nr:chemotaxis protein CheB [Actinoplanes hotanensis]MCM4084660.1 chemotaxis protein CheB [Actinoplanes hotanensis]